MSVSEIFQGITTGGVGNTVLTIAIVMIHMLSSPAVLSRGRFGGVLRSRMEDESMHITSNEMEVRRRESTAGAIPMDSIPLRTELKNAGIER